MFGRASAVPNQHAFGRPVVVALAGNVAVDTTVRVKFLSYVRPSRLGGQLVEQSFSSAPTNNCIDEKSGHRRGDSLRAALPTPSLRSRVGSAGYAACDAKQMSTNNLA
jgi:hypothetical protein